jgi:hypothetical protein
MHTCLLCATLAFAASRAPFPSALSTLIQARIGSRAIPGLAAGKIRRRSFGLGLGTDLVGAGDGDNLVAKATSQAAPLFG